MTFLEVEERMMKIEKVKLSESDYNLKIYRIEHMSEKFKNKSIDNISPDEINQALIEIFAVNPATGKPSAKRTLTRYIDAVSSVFEYGIQNRIITYNPCVYVTPPKNAPMRKRTALTLQQRQAIMSSDDIRYVPAKIMILTGLRRGELTALTWGDVNFKEGYISVTKSFDFKTDKVKSTKTEAGIRNVPITKSLLPILTELKNNYKPIAKYDSQGILLQTRQYIKPRVANDSDYVISGTYCGRMSEKSWYYLLKVLNEELQFEFDWHSLRHTYASLLFEAGVDTLTAKELLGHSDVKTTIGIYTHLSEKGRKLSIAKLDNFLDEEE